MGSLLGKELGEGTDYAESWEIADQGDDQSIVCDGPFAGVTLRTLMTESGKDLFGCQPVPKKFPLLIKYLDAHDWLSLQVHPNDQQARDRNPFENGKTEAWVILEAGPDSRICAGLAAGTTADQLRTAIADGTVEEHLHVFPVRAGDCIFVPAGTVHALGPGIVLAEIQQQSNQTFRFHDWGRTDSNGQPRPLHLEESLACTDYQRGPVNPVKPVPLAVRDHAFEELVRCPYFVIRRHLTVNEFTVPNDGRFRILMTLEGQGMLETDESAVTLKQGGTVLLPASCPESRILPQCRMTVLEILQP